MLPLRNSCIEPIQAIINDSTFIPAKDNTLALSPKRQPIKKDIINGIPSKTNANAKNFSILISPICISYRTLDYITSADCTFILQLYLLRRHLQSLGFSMPTKVSIGFTTVFPISGILTVINAYHNTFLYGELHLPIHHQALNQNHFLCPSL